MKTFYIMRHGETLFNLRHKIQGACDSPLTQRGIMQAKIAGTYLKDIPFDAYYSSTSERASDTLELAMGDDVVYKRLRGLKERDFGLFEGESEDLNPKGGFTYDDLFPNYGGETAEAVKNRMRKTCTEIMEQGHETVLVVSHSGASFHFLRNWLDDETISQILKDGGFKNCSIVKYTYQDKKFEFVEVISPDFSELD